MKQAGGQWHPRQQGWELCYGHVVALDLQARIVEYEATTSRDQGSFPESLYVVTPRDTTYSGKLLHVVTDL